MRWFLNFLLAAMIVTSMNIVAGLVFLKSPLNEAVAVSVFSGICMGIVFAIFLPYHAKKKRL